MNNIFFNKGYTDINPLQFGSEKCASGHTYGPHIRNCYLIHYVVSGKGKFYKKNFEAEVNVGQAFLIRPGEVTTYTADKDEPWEYIWIGFDGVVAKKLDGIKESVFSVDGRIFTDMLKVSKLENTKEEYLISKIFLLISNLFEGKNQKKELVEYLAGYIEENYFLRLYVKELADMANLDSRYLTRLFKSKKGLSLQQYIIDVKMKKAAMLIKDYSVAQTSKMVGYDDVFNFSKIFKKNIGMSPLKYKKYIKEQEK
ncbi:MAG: AraC family transcriptional regulator [Ruminococcaceae bacterium]|nr:AraC family transcriptional regulator [Oscillospiraceae bacterium]